MRPGLVAALLLAAPPAAADPARCAALYAALPDRLGPYALVERDAYDDPRLGYFARYDGAAGDWVTVFVFDAGHDRIDARLVAGYFEGAVADIAELHRRNGHTAARGESRFDPGLAPVLALGYAVTSDPPQGGSLRDVLAQGQSGDCLVKLRQTAPEGPAAEAGFAAAARSLAAVLAP